MDLQTSSAFHTMPRIKPVIREKSPMSGLFRVVSLLEGLSYLLILSVTMGFISREYVSTLGMGHGVLFLLYCVCCVAAGSRDRWSGFALIMVFFASLIPFGFVPVELWLRKREARSLSTALD